MTTPPLLILDDLVDDLATYLGLGPAVDMEKARLVLALALQRAAAVVDPVPYRARPIIIDVAARGYTNPEQVTSETAGSTARTFHMPGVFLTRREEDDLRSLRGPVGTGGAFTVTPGPRMPLLPHW